MLTTSIFLSVFLGVFFGTLCLIFGLLIPLFLRPLREDVREIRRSVEPLRQIDEELRRIGLREFLKPKEEPDPLPPEKVRRKEELLLKGQRYGLTSTEARELKELLNEEVRNDFAAGLINLLVFLIVLALIAAFVNSLTKSEETQTSLS